LERCASALREPQRRVECGGGAGATPPKRAPAQLTVLAMRSVAATAHALPPLRMDPSAVRPLGAEPLSSATLRLLDRRCSASHAQQSNALRSLFWRLFGNHPLWAAVGAWKVYTLTALSVCAIFATSQTPLVTLLSSPAQQPSALQYAIADSTPIALRSCCGLGRPHCM
jgi:hypothetical protein